jgi:tetratricopeptide (TPR) repeat protein
MRPAVVVVAIALTLGMPATLRAELRPGTKVSAMTVTTLEGQAIGLTADPNARAFLLVFWATWSGASPEVLERAGKAHTAWRDRGLVVRGVNVEAPVPTPEQLGAVNAMVKRLGITFPVALDRNLEAFHAYGIVAVPTSVLVSADGTVLAALASYPIAGREQFFDAVEDAIGVRSRSVAAPATPGREPNPRAVRYLNLARTMHARGMGEQALPTLRRAIEADPDFALPHVLLGQVARERATLRESVRVEGEAVAAARVPDAERQQLLAEAERALTTALRLEPANAAGLTELALIHRERGDSRQERELLERAVRADRTYPLARVHLGALRLAVGDAARGRDDIRAAIAGDPDNWRLHGVAGDAYASAGFVSDAVAAYRRALELLWQARTAAPEATR